MTERKPVMNHILNGGRPSQHKRNNAESEKQTWDQRRWKTLWWPRSWWGTRLIDSEEVNRVGYAGDGNSSGRRAVLVSARWTHKKANSGELWRDEGLRHWLHRDSRNGGGTGRCKSDEEICQPLGRFVVIVFARGCPVLSSCSCTPTRHHSPFKGAPTVVRDMTGRPVAQDAAGGVGMSSRSENTCVVI